MVAMATEFRIGETVENHTDRSSDTRSYFWPIHDLTLCLTVESMLVPRDFFSEPPVVDPPRRVPLDWMLVGVFSALALIEGALNAEMYWRWFHIAMVLAMIPTLLWRRQRPLLMLAIIMAVTTGVSIAGFISKGEVAAGPYTAAFLLINVYAVFRWASGRHGAIALGLMAVVFTSHLVIDYGGVAETIGGLIVFLFPAELGVMARLNARNQEQSREEVRAAERERIARELHDSVAHHVSAIAIQAQAGRAVAKGNPEAAVQALSTIEEAASRTLSEMRSMVGTLRGDDGAELAPQQGLSDIASLAGSTNGLDIRVAALPAGSPAQGTTAVGAALFRIAQESVTNAVRHADGATRVDVRVSNGSDRYTLTVRDDGRGIVADSKPVGYGLIGMAERARLLGGTLEAGPAHDGGWLVTAELPAGGAGQ